MPSQPAPIAAPDTDTDTPTHHAHAMHATTATIDTWNAVNWRERVALIDAMHESMNAELQQPQQGPQQAITARPARIDVGYHNDQQMDAIPVRITAELTPFAARVVLWGLEEAMRTGDATSHPQTHNEIRSLMTALQEAGDYGDFLPQDEQSYYAAEDAGLIDSISEQRARAAWQETQSAK